MREGWEYKKLGEVAAFYRGLTYTGRDEVDFSNNVVLRSNNVDLVRNTLNLNELKYISDEITIPKDKMVKKGSILMCMSNGSKQHIGKVAYINKDYNCAFGGFMGLIIPNENYIIPKLLYYYCCSCTFKQFVLSIVNGANINNLRFSDLSNKTVPIPFFSIQSVILSELDMITEMISKYDEQLKELDKLSQSIFYEMFGDPIENEKGWEVKKLEDVCVCITDGDHMPPPKADYGVPFVTISNINKETRMIDFSNTYYVPREYFDKIQSTRKPQIGDVLYTVTGSYGIPIYIDYEMEFCFQRHIGLLRPSVSISSIFLYEWALNKGTKYQADNVATGIAQKTVSIKSLRNFDIILPPLPLQQSFARKIEAIEAMKSKVREAKKEAETLLAARMQYWFE